jgi:hypothetical protein
MHASNATAEAANDCVVFAFVDNDSTVNISLRVETAQLLAKQLDRAVKGAAGLTVAAPR